MATDDKTLRGVGTHGRAEHFVGLGRHDDWMLSQMAVAEKGQRDLHYTVPAGREWSGRHGDHEGCFRWTSGHWLVRAVGMEATI